MTNTTQAILVGAQLEEARLALRDKLLAAGVETVRFLVEKANEGAHQAKNVAMVDRSGAVVHDRALDEIVVRVLSFVVDERVPGYGAGGGGRSKIDWALRADAMDHRHYDYVKLERQRVLGSPTRDESLKIHSSNASSAMLLAMGGVAPKDRSTLQYLHDALSVLVDHARTDQVSFLTVAQREMLIEGIAGTRTMPGHERDWVADAVWHGYHGYEFASDTELVQKLATESLDEIIEGILGPLHIVEGSDQEKSKRHALIEVFTLPQSRAALEAVAESWGDELLSSLPEPDADEESVGQEAPAA